MCYERSWELTSISEYNHYSNKQWVVKKIVRRDRQCLEEEASKKKKGMHTNDLCGTNSNILAVTLKEIYFIHKAPFTNGTQRYYTKPLDTHLFHKKRIRWFIEFKNIYVQNVYIYVYVCVSFWFCEWIHFIFIISFVKCWKKQWHYMNKYTIYKMVTYWHHR